jgi:putative transposase
VAALRRSSREIVEAERPIRRAISRTPHSLARNSAISSRSANDRYRPDGGSRVIDGIPPPSRNHRVPNGIDTPHATAASSLDSPRAINRQKRCRSSRRLIGGRPGDNNGGRPAAIAARALPCATTHSPFHNGVLRRPVEPGEYTAGRVRAACQRCGIKQSMGRPGSALDNAVIESWHSTVEFELRRLERFATKAEARRAIADWIDDYNRARRHSSLGMRSPIDFEHTRPHEEPAA